MSNAGSTKSSEVFTSSSTTSNAVQALQQPFNPPPPQKVDNIIPQVGIQKVQMTKNFPPRNQTRQAFMVNENSGSVGFIPVKSDSKYDNKFDNPNFEFAISVGKFKQDLTSPNFPGYAPRQFLRYKVCRPDGSYIPAIVDYTPTNKMTDAKGYDYWPGKVKGVGFAYSVSGGVLSTCSCRGSYKLLPSDFFPAFQIGNKTLSLGNCNPLMKRLGSLNSFIIEGRQYPPWCFPNNAHTAARIGDIWFTMMKEEMFEEIYNTYFRSKITRVTPFLYFPVEVKLIVGINQNVNPHDNDNDDNNDDNTGNLPTVGNINNSNANPQ